jgi:hypothetical protein
MLRTDRLQPSLERGDNPEVPAGRTPALNLDGDLRQHGWAVQPIAADDAGVLAAMRELGRALGRPLAGRAGALLEIVVPTRIGEAWSRSLSARHGLAILPLHVESSHRTRPCRYVVLGCLAPGSPSVATTLLDRHKLEFTPAEAALLAGAAVLVRSGRRSFYSTILSRDAAYLRFDAGCMEAVDARGRAAMRLMDERLAETRPIRHEWIEGQILVIDNWRMLHGRASAELATGRRLARMMIDDR